MIVDMILLDEKVISSTCDCYIRILRPPDCVNFWYVLLLQSTLIQGTIHASRLNTFRRRLSEGYVYSLSGFEVTRSNNNFPLSDSPVSIRFNDRTSFAETTNSKKDIPTELFRFRSHEQL